MRRDPRRALLVLFAIGLMSPALRSQSPQRPTFRAGVDLVQIDVMVVDESGEPVRGLTQADFSLLDRKERQEIAVFSEVSHEPVTRRAEAVLLPPALVRDVASNATTRTDRTVILVIDDLHLYRGRDDTAKRLAKRVVNELGVLASMAVLFTSGEHSTQVVEDRGLLFAAIESLRGWKAVRRPTPVCESLGGSYCSLQDFFANLDFYKTLEDVARMLGAADGRRKAFVLVSEGIPLRLEHEFGTVTSHLDAVESDLAVDTGGFTEITGGYPVPGGGSNFHFNALRRMMASMQRAGVALYALDPRGFVSQQDLGLECFPPPAGRGFDAPPDSCSVAPTWSSPVRYAQDGLALMADATGGFAVTNTDQLDAGVARIIDDLDHYYLLGFYPTDEKGRGFRPVEVTVNRPGVRVRYRRGYTPGDLPSPPKQDDPLEGLSSGVTPVSDLPMRLSAVPVPDAAAGKAASVRVSLEVTAAGLTEVAASDDVSYLILAVRERNGKPAARASGTFRFNPPSSGPASTSMYQVDTALTLDPGRYQLRAAARSTSSRKGGSVYLTLDVPDFAKDELSVTPIALGYAAGPRLPVLRMPTQPVAPAAARTLPFSPTLDREFVPSDVLRLFAQAARPAGLAGVAPRIEVYDVARDLVVKEFVPAIDDRGRVDVTLRLAGLAPGGYVVRLRASDAVTVLVREVGFVVK